MNRFSNVLLVACAILARTTDCQLLARQTTRSPTTTISTSAQTTKAPTTSSRNIIDNCPDQGQSSPCYVCGGVFGDTIGLNSWYSSSYDVTVATVVHSYVQYDNTLVQLNSTKTITVANATTLYGTYISIGGGSAPTISGIPTDLAIGDGGSTDYAATIIAPEEIANLNNQTKIMSPSAWVHGPGVMFIGYSIISAGTTSTTTALNYVPDIDVFVVTSVPATGWSGTEVFPMPTAMVSAILQADLTVDGDGMPLSLCSNVAWSMGGEPTVHIPVNQLTATSSTTSTSKAVFNDPSSSSKVTTPVAESQTQTTSSSSKVSQKTTESSTSKEPESASLSTAAPTTSTAAAASPQSASSQSTSSAPVLVVITVGSSTVTRNSNSDFVIGTQTASAGGAAVTEGGNTISIASSGTAIVNGQTMEIVTPVGAPMTLATESGSAAAATPIASGAYIVPGGQTLSKDASLVVSGTTFVNSPSGILSVDGQSVAAPPKPSASPEATEGRLTLGTSVAAVVPTVVSGSTAFVISGQTLVSGSAITVGGGTLTIASGGSGIVVAASGSTSTDDVGAAIMSGLGGSSESSASSSVVMTTDASSASAAATGATSNSSGAGRRVLGAPSLFAGAVVALVVWL